MKSIILITARTISVFFLFFFHSALFGNSIEMPPTQVCNDFNPLVNTAGQTDFTVEVTNEVAPFLSLCGGGFSDINNLVDADITNNAAVSITGVGCDGEVAVQRTTGEYSTGTFAGFVVGTSGILNVGVAANIVISTYNNDVIVDSKTVLSSTISLDENLLFDGDKILFGFHSDGAFDEIRIKYNSLVGLGYDNDIYYAVVEEYCEGGSYVCNTQKEIIKPEFPVYVNYDDTGIFSAVCVGCSVDNPTNVIDSDTDNFATMTMAVGVAPKATLAIKNGMEDFPKHAFVGFEISNPSLIDVGLLSGITVSTYKDNALVASYSSANLLTANTTLLGGNQKQIVGFVDSLIYDEVRLEIINTLSVLNVTNVYNLVIQEFCNGPELSCNTNATITNPEYPVFINNENTGIGGVACVLCEVDNPENLINDDPLDYTEIALTVGLLSNGSISVKNQLEDYDALTYVGFDIENDNLIDLSLLEGVTITTYLDGVQSESVSGSNALAGLGTPILFDEGRTIIGFLATLPFDEAQITVGNLVDASLGNTKVYNMIVKKLCEGEILCEETFYLNNPDFPTIVDLDNTGVNGVACVGCGIANSENVISSDENDYATLQVSVGVLGSVSLAIEDPLSTYPSGSTVGFVVDDVNNIVQLDLFESLTICTYLDGVVQECRSGGDLLDLNVLSILAISEEDIMNIGFKTSLPYDGVSIEVGSLASVINEINVYAAYLDTRGSDDEGALVCCINPSSDPVGSLVIPMGAPPTDLAEHTIPVDSLEMDETVWWYTNDSAQGAPYPTPEAAGAGTYYPFIFNSTTRCLTPTYTVTVANLKPGIFVDKTIILGNGEVRVSYFYTNVGEGLTDGSEIEFIVIKPNAVGTLVMDAAPSGWTITERGGSFSIKSTSIIEKGGANQVVFPATFTHDGDNEGGIFTLTTIILAGSGGEINDTNNFDNQKIKIN